MLPMPHGVIFDMDGVLVDSEVVVGRIEAEMLQALGAEITFDDIVANFMGLSDATMAEALRRDWGIELPATFDEERTARTYAAFDTDLQAISGIDAVLDELVARGVPVAVASSSAPERIERSLAITGLADHFAGNVYSASMVEHGKPAPDLFLHAAAQLEVDPSVCVVIEDSPHGVAGGVAAGMRVIGFTAAGHCGPGHADILRTAGAHSVAATGDELTTLLESLVD
jgi:HAD superfamily hydrolase (TIGR01509 family)